MKYLFNCLLLSAFLFSCKSKTSKAPEKEPEQKADSIAHITVKAPDKDSVLLQLTDKALAAFKQKDYNTIAAMVHPDEGVRFSSYGYVDSALDKIITAEWITKQGNMPKQNKLKWGEYDGTGDPIQLTLKGYIDEFIYDAEFLKPEKRKVNGFLGGGNTQNNLLAMYPGCDFTESYFSGFDPKYDGMDWKCLRLVFKMKDGNYYLVGVVHDEWTI